jgi:hypothetical protein
MSNTCLMKPIIKACYKKQKQSVFEDYKWLVTNLMLLAHWIVNGLSRFHTFDLRHYLGH